MPTMERRDSQEFPQEITNPGYQLPQQQNGWMQKIALSLVALFMGAGITALIAWGGMRVTVGHNEERSKKNQEMVNSLTVTTARLAANQERLIKIEEQRQAAKASRRRRDR